MKGYDYKFLKSFAKNLEYMKFPYSNQIIEDAKRNNIAICFAKDNFLIIRGAVNLSRYIRDEVTTFYLSDSNLILEEEQTIPQNVNLKIQCQRQNEFAYNLVTNIESQSFNISTATDSNYCKGFCFFVYSKSPKFKKGSEKNFKLETLAYV